MVILDTDFIITVLRGKPSKAIRIYEFIVNHQITLKTTIFTYAELFEGVYLSYNVPKSLTHLEKFLKICQILPFTQNDGKRFGEVQAMLMKQGTPIGDFDVAIAAITINCMDILLSRNEKHFQHIHSLNYQNWDKEDWDLQNLLE